MKNQTLNKIVTTLIQITFFVLLALGKTACKGGGGDQVADSISETPEISLPQDGEVILNPDFSENLEDIPSLDGKIENEPEDLQEVSDVLDQDEDVTAEQADELVEDVLDEQEIVDEAVINEDGQIIDMINDGKNDDLAVDEVKENLQGRLTRLKLRKLRLQARRILFKQAKKQLKKKVAKLKSKKSKFKKHLKETKEASEKSPEKKERIKKLKRKISKLNKRIKRVKKIKKKVNKRLKNIRKKLKKVRKRIKRVEAKMAHL